MYDKLEKKKQTIFVVLEGIAPLTQNLEIKEHKNYNIVILFIQVDLVENMEF